MSLSSNLDTESVKNGASPYIFRHILQDVPLSEDAARTDAHISCVEFWNDNLYVGTSASEILHFVQIPPEPGNGSPDAGFILASRLRPNNGDMKMQSGGGVQQILILPSAGKACILCGNVVTFYSLPELTPAYESLKLHDVAWIGGQDLNQQEDDDDSTVIMICQKTRIRMVRVGQRSKPQAMQPINVGGTTTAIRRGDIACTSDTRSYSLVDVVERQTIPLFEIASMGPPRQEPSSVSDEESPPTPPPKDNVSVRADDSGFQVGERIDVDDFLPPTEGQPSFFPAHMSSISPPSETQEDLPVAEPGHLALAPPAMSAATKGRRSPTSSIDHSHRHIRPNIISPSATEFLLTTGTSYKEPGVGMYINDEGDVSRPTVEFTRYPHALALDQGPSPPVQSNLASVNDESWLLAVIDVGDLATCDLALEVRSLSPSTHIPAAGVIRLPPDGSTAGPHSKIGIRAALSSRTIKLAEIADRLCVSPFALPDTPRHNVDTNGRALEARTKSERDFIVRLSDATTSLLIWSETCIWMAIRSPMILQFDAQLGGSTLSTSPTSLASTSPVLGLFKELQFRDARTELEFVSVNYLQQKVSLMLFFDLLSKTCGGVSVSVAEVAHTEQALLAGEVDPRMLLHVMPCVRGDIFAEDSSVWSFQGLAIIARGFLLRHSLIEIDACQTALMDHIFPLVKRYLQFWRQKKGFGSISDETNVFMTVELALLHILLLLDQDSPCDEVLKGSVRQELNAVVDRGVDCFAEAVELLEHHHRLYILSRLYQSRKRSPDVLATWKRILESQDDVAGDFVDGEHAMRRYLLQIRDRALVEQYGSWLAKRNPEVGIRVFTDGNGKIKFSPEETLAVLTKHAPQTVRRVLEHLVFDKNLAQYANSLITYYLDGVLSAISSSPTNRDTLRQTYTTYRALQPPKPTYSHYVAQIAWGSHGAASQYDVPAMLSRIEPYQNELVPEMIILGGRQGRHVEAIKLLTHSLGDYDTAIQYCTRGGSGTYSTLRPGTNLDIGSDHAEQRALFTTLLHEFFAISDLEERKQQVSGLLERYSSRFDVESVLELVPDEWTIDVLSGFLQGSFRTLVSDRHDTAVLKGLISTMNLDVSAQMVEKAEAAGAQVALAKDSGVEI